MQATKNKPFSAPTEKGSKQFNARANGRNVHPSHDNSIPHKNKKSNSFNANLFGDIKKLLDIRYALEVYGVQINSKGYASCPFHSEETPSFRVYADTQSFYCFGCGAGGSVIDFVMKRFSDTEMQAAERLNADFNLHLLGRPSAATPHASIEKIQEDKQLLADFAEWEKKAFRTVCDYYQALKFWLEQIAREIEYFYKYTESIQDISFVEYLLDTMIRNASDKNKQLEFYKAYGKAVAEIERKYTRFCR